MGCAPPMTPEQMEQQARWFDCFKQYCIRQNLKRNYSIGSLLGKGTFAKVYDVVHNETGQRYALKTLEKKTLVK